ncbi:hypothetical protein J8J20_21475, partial [Mycobacterium tuberculosis]|nr:hypothetical protein [Mycobacterium tuberculosis]
AVIGPAALAAEAVAVLIGRLAAPATHPEIVLVGLEPPAALLGVSGVTAAPDLAALMSAPDLAVLVTAPAAGPALMQQLARLGTRAVLIVSPGYD